MSVHGSTMAALSASQVQSEEEQKKKKSKKSKKEKKEKKKKSKSKKRAGVSSTNHISWSGSGTCLPYLKCFILFVV